MKPRFVPWLLAGAVLAYGALALQFGQDLNFDLLNYHYYCGYAFLHGCVNRHVVPAGIQTYQPPLLHVLHYLGIASLPPRLFGFLLGAMHGLNVAVIYVLARRVLPGDASRHTIGIALLTAAMGGIGPDALALLGTTFGDNLVSIPALLALVLVLRGCDEPRLRPAAPLLAAGVLAGVATGLKLTMGIYHVGLAVAALVMFWGCWRSIGLFAFGSVLGFAPTGGLWALRLLAWLGNPVFPFANGLFRSEFYKLESFREERWAAHTVLDLVRPALDVALGRAERLQEIGLRDGRYLLVAVALLSCLALLALGPALQRRRWRGLLPLVPTERALLTYWFTGYLLWAGIFHNYRYLAVLEFTAPLVIVVLMRRLAGDKWLFHGVLIVSIGLALTTRHESWGRRPWHESWLQLSVPPLGQQPDSLVLLVGQPISYAIPSFRDDARFALVTLAEFGTAAPWRERVAALIRGHQGPVLLLSTFSYSRAAANAYAAEFGLMPTGLCAQTGSGPIRLRLCELQHERGVERNR